MTLYELREEYKQLLFMMEDPDADAEIIQNTLESLAFDIADKVEGYGTILEQLESDMARLDAEAARMKERRSIIETHRDRLRENLLKTMLETNLKSIKTDHYTVSVRQSPAKLVVDDPFGIPEEYYDPQPAKLDRKKLKEFIYEHPSDFAHLERGQTISIR